MTSATVLASTPAPPINHLTPSELAERWGMSVGHLANLRSQGQGIAYLKLGASVRYRWSEVLAMESASVVLAVA